MEVDPLTGLEAARLGLYVHFPYCLRRCPYCDFTIAIARSIPGARYADAVLGELQLRLAQRPAWTRATARFHLPGGRNALALGPGRGGTGAAGNRPGAPARG